VVTSITEYIDAIEKPTTWMSFTDVKMVSECFRVSDHLYIKAGHYLPFFLNQQTATGVC